MDFNAFRFFRKVRRIREGEEEGLRAEEEDAADRVEEGVEAQDEAVQEEVQEVLPLALKGPSLHVLYIHTPTTFFLPVLAKSPSRGSDRL